MTKYNRKPYKFSVCTMLMVLTVAFGLSSESKANWTLEETSRFVKREILRPLWDAADSLKTKVERFVRGRPDDPLDRAEQDVEYLLKDSYKTFRKRVLNPMGDYLEDSRLFN